MGLQPLPPRSAGPGNPIFGGNPQADSAYRPAPMPAPPPRPARIGPWRRYNQRIPDTVQMDRTVPGIQPALPPRESFLEALGAEGRIRLAFSRALPLLPSAIGTRLASMFSPTNIAAFVGVGVGVSILHGIFPPRE